MRVGIYIPPTHPFQARSDLFERIADQMVMKARAPGIQKFYVSEINSDNLAESAEATKSDVIVIAKNAALLGDHNDEKRFIDNVTVLKAAHPDKKVAAYYDVSEASYLETIKASVLFNERAKGIDIVHAQMPAHLTKHLTDENNPNRVFKSLICHATAGALPLPIVSPFLFTPSPGPTVKLGDLLIDRENGSVRHADVPFYYEKFSAHEAKILGLHAAYQGSYLSGAQLIDRLYKKRPIKSRPKARGMDVHIHNLAEKFSKYGFGKIHTIWGVGRFVRDEDFRISPPIPAKSGNHLFIFEETTGLLKRTDGKGTPISLKGEQAKLLAKLIALNGELVFMKDYSGSLNVNVHYLRKFFNTLFPEKDNYGDNLIQTIEKNGFRMRTPAEMDLMEARLAAPADRKEVQLVLL